MKRLSPRIRALLALSGIVFAVGCGEEKDDSPTVVRSVSEDGAPGTLSLSFANTTTTNLIGDLLTPSYFGLKVISVEVIDSGENYVSIWVNPACKAKEMKLGYEVDMTQEEIAAAREEIRTKEGLGPEATIDPGTKKSVSYTYYDAQDCSAADISSFIDLARTSAEVNAEINSQGLPVPPGTYNKVSIRLCHPTKDTTTFKAQKFLATGMPAATEVTGAGCGVTGAPTSNIVVAGGDKAKVQLSYDISTFVEKTTYSGASTLPAKEGNGNCYLDEAAFTYYCSKVGAASIIPSLVKASF